MIDDVTYKNVLEKGLSLDHYVLLCNIKNNIKPVHNRRIQGFMNLLIKKGYIEDETLTEKGLDLVQNCEYSAMVPIDDAPEMDFGGWVLKVHKACQEKIFKLTGGKQVRDKIDKKSYSFLPNATDLGKVLSRVISIYKLKDYTKIEHTILKYIDRCAQANSWFPILGYYILKNNSSQLVTDMEEEGDGDEEGYKSSQKFV